MTSDDISKMKKLFIAAILAVSCFNAKAQAQENVGFTADRPGASTGPSVVGQDVIQLEQGIQYDGDGGAGTFTFSNTLLRYGLFHNMELRLGGDGFLYQEDGANQGFKPAFSGLSVGTKIKCFEGQGAIPAISVLADFAVPYTASKGFGTDHLAPSLYLLCENPVNDWLSIGYNVGAEWDGSLPDATTFAAICLGFTATETFGCFIESYNYFGALGNVYAMDFGFNWMVGKKVQLDLAANMDLRNPSRCWSVSCGVTWQINK